MSMYPPTFDHLVDKAKEDAAFYKKRCAELETAIRTIIMLEDHPNAEFRDANFQAALAMARGLVDQGICPACGSRKT